MNRGAGIVKILLLVLTVFPSCIVALFAFPEGVRFKGNRYRCLRRVILGLCLLAIVFSGILQYFSVGEGKTVLALREEVDVERRKDYSAAFKLGTALGTYVRVTEGGFFPAAGWSYRASAHLENLEKLRLTIRSLQAQLGIDASNTAEYANWKLEFVRDMDPATVDQNIWSQYREGSLIWAQFYAQGIEIQLPSAKPRIISWFQLGAESSFLFVQSTWGPSSACNELYSLSLDKLGESVGLPKPLLESYLQSIQGAGGNTSELENAFDAFCENVVELIERRG